MENYIFTYIYIIYIKREINDVAFKGLKDKTKTKTKKKFALTLQRTLKNKYIKIQVNIV